MNNTPTLKLDSIAPARAGSLGIQPLSDLPPDIIAASLVWELDGTSLRAESPIGEVRVTMTIYRGDRRSEFEIDPDVVTVGDHELAGGELFHLIRESVVDAIDSFAEEIVAAQEDDAASLAWEAS